GDSHPGQKLMAALGPDAFNQSSRRSHVSPPKNQTSMVIMPENTDRCKQNRRFQSIRAGKSNFFTKTGDRKSKTWRGERVKTAAILATGAGSPWTRITQAVSGGLAIDKAGEKT
ncbi:MAG TPA: hypothetical protein VIN67_10170, partial [Desulfobaccales bacterium]